MKLTAYRDKDRVHLRDLLGVGLLDPDLSTRLPVGLRQTVAAYSRHTRWLTELHFGLIQVRSGGLTFKSGQTCRCWSSLRRNFFWYISSRSIARNVVGFPVRSVKL
jgi:hypothetical protein